MLYGFGEPGKAEDLASAADEIAKMIDAGELDPDWDQEPDTTDDALPEGRRISVQSRVYYVISDEVNFRQYVSSESRA